MQEATTSTLEFPSTTNRDALTEVVHRGAQRMLAEAIEAEVAECLRVRLGTLCAAPRRPAVRLKAPAQRPKSHSAPLETR